MVFKRKYLNNWFIIPMLIILFISLTGFIITSFPKIDNNWTFWLSKGLNSKIITYISIAFFQSGNSELFVLGIFMSLILVESLFKFINDKTDKKINIWLIILIYAIPALGWFGIQSMLLHKVFFWKQGWGDQLEIHSLIPYKTYFFIKLFVVFCETILVVLCMWFCRFKLSKNPFLLSDKYYFDVIKFFIIVLFTYFFVIILKQTTGRGGPINYNFEEIVGKVFWDNENEKWKINWLPSFIKKISEYNIDVEKLKASIIYNINNSNRWKNSEFLPWWKINGNFFENLQYWRVFSWFANPNWSTAPIGWKTIDFPSGHTVSVFMTIFYLFLFVDKTKYRVSKKTAKKISFIWMIVVFLMMILLVVGRLHILSDDFFSGTFAPIAFIFLNRKIDQKIAEFLFRFWKRREPTKTKLEIIKHEKYTEYFVIVKEKKYLLNVTKPNKDLSFKMKKRLGFMA